MELERLREMGATLSMDGYVQLQVWFECQTAFNAVQVWFGFIQGAMFRLCNHVQLLVWFGCRTAVDAMHAFVVWKPQMFRFATLAMDKCRQHCVARDNTSLKGASLTTYHMVQYCLVSVGWKCINLETLNRLGRARIRTHTLGTCVTSSLTCLASSFAPISMHQESVLHSFHVTRCSGVPLSCAHVVLYAHTSGGLWLH
eukprot:1156408-Pelagomonas_calceolata.AAC.3